LKNKTKTCFEKNRIERAREREIEKKMHGKTQELRQRVIFFKQ
jgi:hypothetical protein